MRALVVVGLLLLALAAACGGEGEPKYLPADELVARAYEAMTQTSFAADVPPEFEQQHELPYSVKYGPPDRLLITGGGYEWPAYLFLAGKESYVSETGKGWTATFGGQDHGMRLLLDPRELLRIATDVSDEGTQSFDGRPHRVVAARQDVAKFADEYLTDVEIYFIMKIRSTICPECTLAFDRQRLESLGYRNPDGEGVHLFKGEDIRVKAHPEEMMFWIRGARELTPALKEELGQVLEAYSVDPALLDAVEIQVHDEREGTAEDLEQQAEVQVRFWIDPQTFLVSKMDMTSPDSEEMGVWAFVDYGEVELPEPEPAILYEEADLLFGVVQRRWTPLARALEAYARSHGGLYPDELTPAVLQGALESKGLKWPENPFTGEPMRDTSDRDPGDFHYRPSADRQRYCAEVYEWEGEGIPMGPQGAAATPCPEFEGSSP